MQMVLERCEGRFQARWCPQLLADGSETQFGRHKLFVKQPGVRPTRKFETKFRASSKIAKAGGIYGFERIRFIIKGRRRRFAPSGSVDGLRPATDLMKGNIYKVTTRGICWTRRVGPDASRIVFSDECPWPNWSGEKGKDAVFVKRLVGVRRVWFYVIRTRVRLPCVAMCCSDASAWMRLMRC